MNPEPTIPYASVTENRGRVWAAAAVTFSGLSLIVLGGCFLVGVAAVTADASMLSTLPLRTLILVVVLYALAGLCFIGALLLLVRGLRVLFQIMRG